MAKGNILVVPDLHEPFEHKDFFKFCVKVYEMYNCKRVICTGDIIDHHRIARHTTEPDADGAEQEKEKAIKKLTKWYRRFPEMDIILGNHDLIPYRQAKEIGIPASAVVRLTDWYLMPKKWLFHKELIVDNVFFTHVLPSGINGAILEAKKKGMSVVGSHTHTAGGVVYFKNKLGLYYGLNVGCGIDVESYAMRYSNSEPTLGCGVVVDSREAYFIPMKSGG